MPCPYSGKLLSAWSMPAPKAATANGHGSVALLKKSWYFWRGVRGAASLLRVVLKVAMTPKTRWFSSCWSCTWAFLRASSSAVVFWAGDVWSPDPAVAGGVELLGDA